MRTIFLLLGLLAVLNFMGCDSKENVVTKEVVQKAVQMQEKVALQRVTPEGTDVPNKQEIVFQFDKEMVPLGKMDRASADVKIKITPKLECQWRWLSRSALACKLDDKDRFKFATEYNISVAKIALPLDGIQLFHDEKYSFSTKRPSISYTGVETWTNATTPYFYIDFNMPVTKASVLASLQILDGNTKEFFSKIKIIKKVETDTENGQITEYLDDDSDPYTSNNVWIVAPLSTLAPDKSYIISTLAGLITQEGPLKGEADNNLRQFHTFGAFKFIGINCTIDGSRDTYNNVYFSEGKRCEPLSQIGFVFSAPVLKSTFASAVKMKPALNGGRKDYDPWGNSSDYSRLNSLHSQDETYTVWLPEYLKAYRDYRVWFDKNDFTDEFGRTLLKSDVTDFKTDHREARLRMTHSNVVLEKGVDSFVPIYATNLSNIKFHYNKTIAKSNPETFKPKGVKVIETMNVEDIAYKTKARVRDALDGSSGAVYGEISASNIRYPSRIFAQVTPFQVHAKLGHFSSLVWVSKFADAKPVEGARVTLYSGFLSDLHHLKRLPYRGVSDKDGLVHFVGTSEIDPQLNSLNWIGRKDKRYFVKVEKDGDMALLPLEYNFKVYNSNAYSSMQTYGQHAKAWGTTAQGVYKLGDEVSYKIYVRDQNNTGLITPNKYLYTLEVRDPLDKVIYTRSDIVLNKYGSLEGAFKVPKEGAVGHYRFKLEQIQTHKGYEITNRWYPLSVLVSDFTPASFSVKTQINGSHFKVGERVDITAMASLYSGGPYTKAAVRMTAHLFAKPFSSSHPLAKGFDFSSKGYGDRELLNISEVLDNKGESKSSLVLNEGSITYGELFVETSVKDERGKFVASHTTANYAQRDRFVGLKATAWVYNKNERSEIKVLVVDEKGIPQSGSEVTIQVQYKLYKSVRVKGAGNAFVIQNSSKWVDEGSCKVASKEDAVSCSFTPKNIGSYRFVARVKDTKGKENTTTLRSWVSGSGAIVWDQSSNANLDIIPENTTYKIGDTARYLIKNPYPGAKALITIERYGILDSWVETLETGTPIIEVPIKADYLPGFYLSVVVVSPRVAKPVKEGQVDLGKPSYKMGYVRCVVQDPVKELVIDITSNKKVYEPQEEATINIHVKKKAEDKDGVYELAVVVVDASVFALNTKGKSYYDPYRGFNALETLDVTNYSLMSRLIGRQKFEHKGANPGGDGGESTAVTFRDDFKYIAYWNASILTDAKGDAAIKFKMPDNLTGWKVFVIGMGKNETMGLGEHNIKTNKSTQLNAVMPNQVLEGDHFSAGFNLMNRTGEKRNLKVKVVITLPDQKPYVKHLNVALDAYERHNIYFPIDATTKGIIGFKIRASDTVGSDGLVHTLEVHKRSSLETMANFGSTLDTNVTEAITIPDGIVGTAGEVGVILSTSVIGNVEGAFSYIRDYPYWCWEQRLTKAVAAAQYKELEAYLPESLEWKEADTLTKKMLLDASSFQAPNGGMAFWVGTNAHVSPYLSAYTALEFAWLKEQGYIIPSGVEKTLHAYLKEMLRSDIMPSYFSAGMSATVRAVALNALARSGDIDASDISRYFSHKDKMSLFGKANYLQAMLHTQSSDAKMKKELLTNILSTGSQSARKYQFDEVLDSGSSYLLATPMRANCAILTTFIDASHDKILAPKIKGIAPKMIHTITQKRGGKEYWENTQENIFCMSAIVDYAKVYESTPVDMNVVVSYDKKSIGKTSFKSLKAPSVAIFKDIEPSDVGKKTALDIKREGTGRLYYTTLISYAPKAKNASRVNSGMEIRREYSKENKGVFEILKSPMQIKQGDIVRVDLFISLPTARHFVVVNDPIPGGLESINSDLATSSVMDASKGKFVASKDSWWFKFSDWTSYGRYNWSFYHKELRYDSARFYSDYLPAGNYHLSYVAQAIAEGSFSVMPSHIEEMYDPDVYGKSLPATLNISKD